jgi:uncharacterized membrane protein
VRQFFVLRLKGRIAPSLIAATLLLLLAAAFTVAPRSAGKAAATVPFATVRAVIEQRCATCHAAQPMQPGFNQPPKGVVLQTTEQIVQHATKIAETTASRYMPLGNLTQMSVAEREQIAAWFAQGAKPQ